jgi:tRNA pseudouridine55 synthase
MDGIVVINKAAGLTSHDVVARVRRILKMKRVGHTGTLDPEVTGVLPICLGKGTRMVEYLQDLPKEYEAEMTLGTATDTEDQTGTVVGSKPVDSISEEEIHRVFHSFLGEVEQVPPMYSAVKVNGKRLYELAREGQHVERKPRTVTIYQVEILSMDLQRVDPKIRFRVLCSKGTYVRTLCVDIGKSLGYPAHMSNLVRTATGPFRLGDSVTLEQLELAVGEGIVEPLILPIEKAVAHLPRAVLIGEEPHDVWNGKTLSRERFAMNSGTGAEDTLIAVFAEDGSFLAIYRMEYNSPWLKPVKVFR